MYPSDLYFSGNRLYSLSPLRYNVTYTLARYPTQSHYPDPESPHLCLIVTLERARLDKRKYQFNMLLA